MSRNILNKVAFVAFVALALACKTKKVMVINPPVNKPEITGSKKSENIKLLSSNDISFNTLAVKARADLDINGNSNNVTMNIRMEKDKKIWVSITAFAGIEVARALITPDSLKVRNNLQSVYLKKPFSYVHTFTGKQVNFKLLQSILTGNTIEGFLVEDAELNQVNGVWELKGEKEDLVYRILFNALLKVGESDLNSIKSGQALRVTYAGYQKIDSALFPSGAKINSMSGTKRININLDFSNVERNVPLEFPFNVPTKFEVIN